MPPTSERCDSRLRLQSTSKFADVRPRCSYSRTVPLFLRLLQCYSDSYYKYRIYTSSSSYISSTSRLSCRCRPPQPAPVVTPYPTKSLQPIHRFLLFQPLIDLVCLDRMQHDLGHWCSRHAPVALGPVIRKGTKPSATLRTAQVTQP
jgi:hypothetical protein